MIRKGQQVAIRPEVADVGDDLVRFVAVEDEDGGRMLVMACLGLAINPTRVELVCDLIVVS